MSWLQQAPRFDRAGAAALARELYGLEGHVETLPSERDQNFLVTAGGTRYVLKIANAAERREMLEAQNAAMAHVEATALAPHVLRDRNRQLIAHAPGGHFVRLLTWIPGEPLGTLKRRPHVLLEDLGFRLGQLSRALESFDHPAVHREFQWDLSSAIETVRAHAPLIGDETLRGVVERVAGYIFHRDGGTLRRIRRSVVHGDANDYNVLVTTTPQGGFQVGGLIDFGDMLFSYTAAEPAVAIAYAVLDDEQPLEAAAAIARGYHAAYPVTEEEISVLFDLALLRLCLSASLAAYQQRQRPDDEYLAISQGPIRRTLPKLAAIPPDAAEDTLRAACGLPGCHAQPEVPKQVTLARRHQRIGRNVSIGYRDPLKVVGGWMQYLFDDSGRQYLDAYNNVPHVGHAHPHITNAAVEQMRAVSTNTRYLHDRLWQLAERLTATLPDPLSVCYFVNSGSEANELALRLARAHTGAHDVIVLDAAYHGNTNTLIDISPYKFNGPGGRGAPGWVHVAPIPDDYRGAYKRGDADAGRHYADTVGSVLTDLRRRDTRAAAFICETCPSVGGQILPPPGYLEGVYRHARAAGVVCIADEVQTGYGRMGTHFYAFELQNVVPDIVVLGKPMGNGYPLGAVVTTREIAESFANGMEFFSTFGGSTVSCAVGLAVLDVLENEALQAHAHRTGEWLRTRLLTLPSHHAIVGDVRGAGLFFGVELVHNRETLEPAAREAGAVVDALREQGILIGTDGPWHNVLKIRPPMPFNTDDAGRLVDALDVALSRV